MHTLGLTLIEIQRNIRDAEKRRADAVTEIEAEEIDAELEELYAEREAYQIEEQHGRHWM